MDTILQSVGERIRDIRKTKGLSQEQLGERAGFHFSYIGGLERGERNISLTNLVKVAQSLNIPLQELFVDLNQSALIDNTTPLIDEVLFHLKGFNESEIRMTISILEAISRTFKTESP